MCTYNLNRGYTSCTSTYYGYNRCDVILLTLLDMNITINKITQGLLWYYCVTRHLDTFSVYINNPYRFQLYLSNIKQN